MISIIFERLKYEQANEESLSRLSILSKAVYRIQGLSDQTDSSFVISSSNTISTTFLGRTIPRVAVWSSLSI